MNAPTDPRTSSSRGFSLVELLIVVGIIAIMAAVVLPTVTGYLRVYKIRGATQEVAKEIQAARGSAISKNVNFGMVLLILDDSRYQWVAEDDLNVTNTDFSPNVRVTLVDALSTTIAGAASQRGPVKTLPVGVQFAKTCPGLPLAGATWERGMRFNRLGAWCRPSTGEPCPAIGVGADFVLSHPSQGAVVCVSQPGSGFFRTVAVSPGGRVLNQQ
jgi:prepilin-type N-terminal cleavage/methylation domain-containing protein